MMRNELRVMARMLAATLFVAALSVFSGCGGSTPATTVAITPSATSVSAGGSVTLSANVANDKGGGGVAWSLSPASGCGSLNSNSGATVTYTAPKESDIASDCTATITATVIDSAAAVATQAITTKAVSLSLGAGVSQLIALDASGSKTLSVQLANDASGSATIHWAIDGSANARRAMSSVCGSLSASTGASVTYTAPAQGDCTANVTASVSANPNVKQRFTINVNAPLAIASASLKSASVQTPYSMQMAASGGQTPYVWSLAGGSTLPTGMTITTDGLISGSTPNYGNYNVAIAVTDALGAVAKQSYTLTVNPASLSLGCSKVGPGYVGEAYNGALETSGGTGDDAFVLVSGALPPGLSFVNGSGIAGTPTTVGAYSFTVKETDSATGGFQQTAIANCSIAVNSALSITSAAKLPAAMVGAAYSQQLLAAGGSGANVWSLASGSSLPAGLTLSSSGLLSGETTAAGSFSFSAKVVNGAGASASQNFTLVSETPLAIAAATLPNASLGVRYSQTLVASGGQAPYSWTLGDRSSLPTGIQLDSNGVLSGTPVVYGDYDFTAQVDDSSDNAMRATVALHLKITAQSLSITTASVPYGVANTPYNQQLAVSGGLPPYTWSLASGASLPEGLSLSSAGVLSGIVAQPFSSVISVQVKDSAQGSSQQSATAQYQIAVYAMLQPASPDSFNGTMNASISQQLTAQGGVAPYTWTLADGSSLPPGISLSSSGLLSGVSTKPGSYAVSMLLADSASPKQTFHETYNFVINSTPVSITTPAQLMTDVQGRNNSQTLAASGGYAPYTWSLGSGSTLPDGLSLTPDGVVSGAPTGHGNFDFDINVADSAPGNLQQKSHQHFAITVIPTASITTNAALPTAYVGVVYSQPLSAAGGQNVYGWALASGSKLPAGLTLSAQGVISGSPTTAGDYSFTIQLTDSASTPTVAQTVSQAFTLTVVNQPTITTQAEQPGLINHAFSLQMSAAGGVGPYAWNIASGALPTGLSLSSAGLISGSTNGVVGVYSATIQLTDASPTPKTASIAMTFNIAAPTMTIAPSSGFGGAILNRYNASSISITQVVFPLSAKVTSGSLPPGMALSSANSPTYILSGTPTSAGVYKFTLTITDQSLDNSHASNTQQSVDFPMTVQVVAPLNVATSSLPDTVSGASYTQLLSADGGAPAYKWELCGGSLPKGLTLSPSGSISGKVGAPGAYNVCVLATDSGDPATGGISQSASANLILKVTADQLNIVTDSLPGGVVNLQYGVKVAVVGGSGDANNYTATFVGLPAGLTAQGLTLSGAPTTAGDYSVTLSVVDSTVSPAQTTASSFLLYVGAAPTGVRNSVVRGGYVCKSQGRSPVTPGALNNAGLPYTSEQHAWVFAFNADGAGAISGGLLDVNFATGYMKRALGSSTYMVGYGSVADDRADNRGLMTLDTGYGGYIHYAMAAGQLNAEGVAQQLYLTEIDILSAPNQSIYSTGVCYQQDASAISSTTTANSSTWLTGGFAYGMNGEDINQLPIATGAVLTGTGGAIANIDADTLTTAGASHDTTSTGVVATDADSPAFGRLSVAMSDGRSFALYIVDANHGVIISTDNRSSQPLLIGEIRKQQKSSYTTSDMGYAFVNRLMGYKIANGAIVNEASELGLWSINASIANGSGQTYGYDGQRISYDYPYVAQVAFAKDGRAYAAKDPSAKSPDYGGRYYYYYDQSRAFTLDSVLGVDQTTRNLMYGETFPRGSDQPADGVYAVRVYSSDPTRNFSSGVWIISFSAASIVGLYDEDGDNYANIGVGVPVDAMADASSIRFNGQLQAYCASASSASMFCINVQNQVALTDLQQ